MVLAMAQSLVQAWAAETAAASAPERSRIKTKQRKRTRDLKKWPKEKGLETCVPERAATSAVATEPGNNERKKSPIILLFMENEDKSKAF